MNSTHKTGSLKQRATVSVFYGNPLKELPMTDFVAFPHPVMKKKKEKKNSFEGVQSLAVLA